jgi:hypothetical protein
VLGHVFMRGLFHGRYDDRTRVPFSLRSDAIGRILSTRTSTLEPLARRETLAV